MYLVIKNFVDIVDKCHRYVAGDEYPRAGYEPTAERINALLTGDNKAGVKLIKEVKSAEPKAEPVKEEPKAEPKKKAAPKKKTSTKKAAPKGGKKASK